MAERTIKITIVGDASKASKAMADAGTSAGTLEGKVEGLSTKWGNFGTVFAGVVAGGALQQVGGWLKDGAAGAAEDSAAMDRLKIAVANSGASYDDYGKTIDEAISRGQDLAFTDGETATALSALVSMTGDTDEAMRRLSTAQDLARGTGMSLEQAAKLLGKVTDENATVLKRYGINVAEGADAQAVMNEVDSKYGGQAAQFAESDSAKWLKLTQQMGELQETIGAFLIPVMTLLVGAIAAILTTAQPVIDFISANWIPIMIALAPALAAVGVAIIMGLVPALIAKTTALWASVAAWLAANAAMLPIIAVALAIGLAIAALYLAWSTNFLGIQDIVNTVIGYIGPFISGAIDAIRTHWDTVWNAIKTAFELVWTVISTAVQIYLTPLRIAIETALGLIQTHWDTVWNAIKTIYEGVWQAISTIVDIYLTPIRTTIETVINAIRDHWAGVWQAIQTAVEVVWGPISGFVSGGMGGIQTTVTTVLGGIQTTWDTIWGAIKATAETIWAVGGGIHAVVSGGIDAVKGKIDEVLGAIQGVWDTGWGTIKGTVDAIWNGANGILRIADGGISSVRTVISDTLSAIKSQVWDPIWGGFTGTVQTVMDTVKGIVNGVIDGINGVLGAWNSLSFSVPEVTVGPVTFGGQEIGTPDIGTIPRLAAGGIVMREMLATVGDGGPEAVVPLSQLPGIIRDAMTPAGAGAGVRALGMSNATPALGAGPRANGQSGLTASDLAALRQAVVAGIREGLTGVA